MLKKFACNENRTRDLGLATKIITTICSIRFNLAVKVYSNKTVQNIGRPRLECLYIRIQISSSVQLEPGSDDADWSDDDLARFSRPSMNWLVIGGRRT